MMKTPVNIDSVNIIDLIKNGTSGIEIGVWKGSTTRRFLQKNLSSLTLIDPWSIDPYKKLGQSEFDSYLSKYSTLVKSEDEENFQSYYDEVYEEVYAEFGNLKNVNIFRGTSSQWFENWNGEQVDWIYIDGDHTYEGALYDLNLSVEVVKKGGLIIGDDYKWKENCGKEGVTQAANEFSKSNGFEIIQHGKRQFVMVNQ